jgi:hypothetical protein
MNLSKCTRASLTSTGKLLYSTVRMPNMYGGSSCPLYAAWRMCWSPPPPPLSNPIHKTPTIKYGHQVNYSDKRRKNQVLTNPRRNKASSFARVSACPKHPHEPIVALEPQQPLLAHHHVLSHPTCHHRVTEDRAPEQAIGVHYHLI